MADETNQDGKLFVCATAQNSDLAQLGFEALTWVEVGRIVTFPEIGISTNYVSQDYVNTAISQCQKGVRSGNETEILCGKDNNDAGQDALIAAGLTKNNFAFKREFTDSPNTATTTNSIVYFRALVGEPIYAGGGVEDFENVTFSLQINGQRPIFVKPEAI